MQEITQEYLKEIFDYKDGNLFWKKRTGPRSKINEIAGHLRKNGYVQVILHRKIYVAHRLIWLWIHGEWPKNEVDHIDGNKSNNKIENLRDVTKSQNQQNRLKTRQNTSGYKGVFFHARSNKWIAKITLNKKQNYLGYFSSPLDAHNAYCEAAKKFHGEFAKFV